MSSFVGEEELKAQQEAEEMREQELLKAYDRTLFCEDPARITELVKNVFVPAQKVLGDVVFYENDDNNIKWSLQTLSTSATALTIVEGLLSHRMQSGLLAGIFADENSAEFKVLPSNTPVLKNTAFLGKIKDMKMVNDIKENVIRLARIDTSEESANLALFAEPINANLPQAECFCIALINLSDLQMANLKKASKVKKVSDKVAKRVENFNTSTYGVMKIGLEGVVAPSMEVVGKSAGLVAGTLGVATFKAGASFVEEVTNSVANADLRNCSQVKGIKHNCARIAAQFGKNDADSSFSFNF